MAKKTQPEINNEVLGKMLAMLKEHNKAEELAQQQPQPQQQYVEPIQTPPQAAIQEPIVPTPPKHLEAPKVIGWADLGNFLRACVVMIWLHVFLGTIFVILLLLTSTS